MIEKEKLKLAKRKIAEFMLETGHTEKKTKEYFEEAFKQWHTQTN